MLRALAMTSQSATAKRGDARLWVTALGLSLLCNVALLFLAGLAFVESQQFKHPALPPTQPAETVRFLAPELAVEPTPATDPASASDPTAAETAEAEAAAEPGGAPPVPAHGPSFARTSDDQRGKRPDHPAFIGERDTEATSDTTPDPTAPAMPAQAGVPPRHPGDFETTVSEYKDGALTDSSAPAPEPPTPLPTTAPEPLPAPPAAAAPGEITDSPGTADKAANPAPPAHLAEGPNPVDVPIPLTSSQPTPTPAAQALPRAGNPEKLPTADDLKPATPPPSPPDTPRDPAFRGNQRKTTIRGSISRSGRSALDVEDSPLGRYQATISRAVELEWQRNCVRYRDFITPGFLTVRFFVDSTGKVRNVQFVGAMQTGQQQKGFTLNSIRDAAIPAMPAEVRKDFQEDPLELIFNFYF